MAIKYLDSKRIRGSSTAGGFTNGLGSAADGTNHGTTPASATSAIYGATSLDMDGTDDYVSIPNTSLGVATSWSISCWIYPDTNASEAFMGIWSGTSANKVFGIEKQPSQLNFTVTVGSTNYNISGQNPATTQSKWNHLVFVKDGSTLRAYVDNVATPTASVNSGSASTSPDQRFTIGDRWESSNGSFSPFEGKFQEVAFWNRAITTSEINEIFNGYDQDSATASDNTGKKISETLATTQLGVLGYWSLDSITPTNSAGLVDEKATLVTAEAQAIAGWTSVGSTVTISNGALRAVSLNTNSDDRMYKALGLTVSNTAWVCQFEANISTSNHTTLIGLTDGTGNLNAYDTILCDYNGSNIIMREYNGSTIGLNSTGIAVSTGIQYYITLTRTDDDGLKLDIRTDSHSGTLVGTETGTIGATTVDLDTVQSGAYGREAGSATYNIDNLKIYSGVTTATGTPVYETTFGVSSDLPENTLFEETDSYKTWWLQSSKWIPMPTYSGVDSTWQQTDAGADFTIDTANNEVDYHNQVNANNVYFDLNSIQTLSTSKWLIRYAVTQTGTSSGGNGNTSRIFHGVSKTGVTESNSTTTDFVGYSIDTTNGTALLRPHLIQCDDRVLHTSTSGSGSGHQASFPSPADSLSSNGTKYYYELSRDGANYTGSIYSDSDYSTLLGSRTHTMPDEALRYFIFSNYVDGGGISGVLSDFKYYNGISEF